MTPQPTGPSVFFAPKPADGQGKLGRGERLLPVVGQALNGLPQRKVADPVFLFAEHELIATLIAARTVLVALVVVALWAAHR
ncbi:hypothetical protein E4P82_07350 [Candidatus Competibacter phosphatis]|uniref:Uncharacterized protein n=1 Tax=Candidatus Competibacter phosphatis TaxID=221280 RepID=A0ABX1TLR5_9GAMM|nr:hypothetical protein [Candidatus Competibacter phosphatis]NMQ19034.1 hypothetical protein [Candidatus Competibacter phosphatis]